MTDTWEMRRVRAAGRRGASVYGPAEGTPVPSWGRPSWTRPVDAGHGHAAGCACPVCSGLETAVRPRFFAGQLLTDVDLTALQQYVIDKNRLHNLHLHGWGVVCGLQMLCNDCGDGVLVRPGYAIDPCGRDVVVPDAEIVDVLGLVQACRVNDEAPVCDPPRTPKAEGCGDEQHWCITVRYREQQARPVTPIGGTEHSSCSCGSSSCGGSCGRSPTRKGHECTCGRGGSRNTGTCSCAPPAPAPATTGRSPECEPTRTYECYEFGVCRSDGSCHDLGERLDGTFPARIVECIREIQPIFTKRLTKSMQLDAGRLLLATDRNPDRTDAHEAVCALLDAVIELYERDPLRTMCVLPAELQTIDCHPRGDNEPPEEYRTRLVMAMQALVMLVLAYLRDCICFHALAPCPTDPCDDRVVLGCVTLRDGKVVEICNLECRRYAGSFVSRNYWLPIGPVLSWLAGLVCCFPLLERYGKLSHSRVRRTPLFGSAKTTKLRAAISRNDFALLADWRRQARRLVANISPTTLLERLDERLDRKDEVDLTDHVGRRTASVSSALKKSGVTVQVQEVGLEREVPVFATGLLGRVPKGAVVTAYVRDGKVLGFAHEPGGG